MIEELGISERQACEALGQHRSTQRKKPLGRQGEKALTNAIIALAELSKPRWRSQFLCNHEIAGLLPDFPSRQSAIFSGILLPWKGGLDAKETMHERADRFCAAAI